MPTDASLSRITVGEIEIAYASEGHDDDPPVLLIAGLGSQLIFWPSGLRRQLLDRGLRVIRFDNRDAGLSTHLHDLPAQAGPPDRPADTAYSLADMAADTVGLIARLGLGSAHIVGLSLGGMIAQMVAIRHPEAVRSLTSIMSTTGNPAVGQATEAAMALLLSPAPVGREAVLDNAVLGARVVGSPGYPFDEAEIRERAAQAFDRAYDPAGTGRQLAAAVAGPERTEDLGRLDVPALVIHGAADTLIGVSGGRATAEAIPGAELIVLDGMGHELPAALWPVIADRIAALVRRVDGGSADPTAAYARAAQDR